MAAVEFEAIGTHWTIIADDSALPEKLLAEIQNEVKRFDQTYSRFIEDSLVNCLARQSPNEYRLSAEFETMLAFGLELSRLTEGAFDLNTALAQEAYGYDQTYSFKNSEATAISVAPGIYSLKNHVLHQQGQVKLDFGAFGKGYLIDLVAAILESHHLSHYLIDGGRDFYGTCKQNGQPWRIALEHPWLSDKALGIVMLDHQGLACSNSHHRRVGNFHHLLNGQSHVPISKIASVFVVASNATLADGISTALFVAEPHTWENIQGAYPCQSVIVTESLQVTASHNFEGEIFA